MFSAFKKVFGGKRILLDERILAATPSSSKKLDDSEIPYEKIASATNNFGDQNLIHKGAFLNVYKGKLLGSGQLGNIVVQRRLDDRVYEEWEASFWKELLVASISDREVSVVGFCSDKDIIVYEHIGHGRLKKDVRDPTFDWTERLKTCISLAVCAVPVIWKLTFGSIYSNTYLEMVYIVSLGDLMFEVICENNGEKHATPVAVEQYEKGELEKMIHPHLREQISGQSLTIFLETAYNCIKYPRLYIHDIRKPLEKALRLQRRHEYHKKFADLEIPYEDIELATNNFGDENLIYEDASVNFYKGKPLGFGQPGNIVVQRRSDDRKELLETSGLLSHPFVIGVCAKKEIIVYQHVGNGRLKKDASFNWTKRLEICLDLVKSWKHMDREVVFILCLGDLMFQVLCENKAEEPSTLRMAMEHYEKGELEKMIDPNLRVQMYHQSLSVFSTTAYDCIKQPHVDIYDVKERLHEELRLQSKHEAYLERIKIELKDIRLSTNNFAKEHVIGSGTYGTVYKAELEYFDRKSSSVVRDTVAIKRISKRQDGLGDQGFFAELNMLSSCEHNSIISLLGFCHEGSKRILVYEYAFKQSLSEYLGSTNDKIILTWAKRLQICLDIAHGLDYLHNNTKHKPRIIHRDVKSDNILLGENWNAKIGDFGLSKFHPMNQASTINTEVIAGTPFYLDPEYENTGQLKKESDIYSFGVVLFEILCGRLAYDSIYLAENNNGLPPIARQRVREGTLKEMVDPQMKEADEYIPTLYYGLDQDSLNTFSKIAYRCLAETQSKRPTIEEIITELQYALHFQENREDTLVRLSLEDIKLGSQNFIDKACIIRGAVGKAYKGKVWYRNELKDVVAMRLYKCKQKEDEFLKELQFLVKHRHEHIVDLVGYCREENEKIIVYELACIGTLDMHLSNAILGWVERLKICIDIASALKFLHESVQVIHRDFKSASILLNGDWRAKISDFRLYLEAPLNKKIEDYDVNDVSSTPGYCDPSYWGLGFLTKESDIYSLGVVLFEILCGKSTLENYNGEGQFLDDSVKKYFEERRLDEIIFEDIKKQSVPHSLSTFQMIAYQCLHHRRQKRPAAAEVVVQLKKALEFQLDPSSVGRIGSYSPEERVPNFVGGRGNNKGVWHCDPHADCSENTAASSQAKLDDISIGLDFGHDGEGLQGVGDAMGIKLGYLANASEVFETTHLKRGSASWEPFEFTSYEKMKQYQQDLEAQLQAERARTAELAERMEAERARNAELEERMEADRTRMAELEERIIAERARTIELAERMEAEQARNAELELRMEADQARTAESEERIVVDQARTRELEEMIMTERARTAELENRIMNLEAREAERART